LQSDATALFTMFRNVAGSIGISVSTAAITARTQVHTAYLAANLSRADPNFRETLSHVSAAIKNLGTVAGDTTQAAMGQIERTLIAQAGLLAYMDVFLYCAILAFIFVPLTFFFSPVKATRKVGAE
jgi:DHA2 family multidrug resistance protein